MIRINLLPFRERRNRERVARQVSIALSGFVFLIIILFGYTQFVKSSISNKRVANHEINAKIISYKGKAKKVTQIKHRLRQLEDKLKVVNSLELKRFEQLDLVAALADLMVPEKMWIESLKSSEDWVRIQGVAFDNPSIADFMRKLEGSSLFSKVDLKKIQIRKFGGGVALEAFDLACKKNSVEPVSMNSGKKEL
ncbi:MAG: PilN domain-containing protein [Desulfovibrionales bacterium]|nr:PilN domain-containing protein [Desulfovibrionales bacterium]